MFYWKNAVVMLVLLAIAMVPAYLIARNNRERGDVARLATAAAGIVLIAVTGIPLSFSLLLFALLMMAVSRPWLPLSGIWLFFFVWTPAVGVYLGFGGLYLGVLSPTLIFSLALLMLYVTSSDHQGRRGVDSSDMWLFAFLAIFCICASLRGTWTSIPRLIVDGLLGYGITYQVLSRARIRDAEMTTRLFIIGVGAASLLCLFETLWKWPLYSVLSFSKSGMLEGVPQMMLFRGGWLRAYGPFGHPLAGSAICGMAGVAFFAFLQMRPRSWLIWVLGLMLLIGLASTVSRTGLVAFSVGVSVFAILCRRWGIAVLVMLVGATVVIGAPLVVHDGLQGSANYRYDLMLEAPRLLGNHIWFGYREALSDGTLAKLKQGQGIVDLVNVYVSLLIFGGVASLLPYLVFLGTSISRYRALRRARPSPEQLLLGQACISMQAGFFAMTFGIGAWSTPMLLSCVWTALLSALRAEALRKPALKAPARPIVPGGEGPIAMPSHERLPALR